MLSQAHYTSVLLKQADNTVKYFKPVDCDALHHNKN